jgi:hypothetical protein
LNSYCTFSCLDKRFDFHVWLVHCKLVTGNCYELFWLVGSVIVSTAIKFVYLYCAALICLCIIILMKFGRSWWFHNVYYTILICLFIILKDLDDDFLILKSCLPPFMRCSPHSFIWLMQIDPIIRKSLFLQEVTPTCSILIEFGNHKSLIEEKQACTIWRIWLRGSRTTRLAPSQICAYDEME